MRPGRARVAGLAALALVQTAGDCGGGDGGGGGRAVVRIQSPDVRCAVLGSEFPPGFDFVPGNPGRVWVADLSPPTLVPFDVDDLPFEIPAAPGPLLLPFDSDGDGREEGSALLPLAPVLDDVAAAAPDLALVTASSYEEVLFLDPGSGLLRPFEVAVPAFPFVRSDNPFLPPPGSSALRTGVSTLACVRPPPGALDSRGDPISASVPAAGFCDPAAPSYLATFTSGAAIAASRLFVSTSNLGDGAGTANPQFLPGSVLVYDLDLSLDPPRLGLNPTAPVILTTAFNPTQVTAYGAGGREFILVTASGALGIAEDDPSTPEIEGATLPLSAAAIDVIDAATLELVATIPLGPAGPAFDRLAIDPTGRVAALGSAAARWVLAVDLAPLANLPSSVPAPVVLDGSSGENSVIFDAATPFRIPGIPQGAPEASCPGFTAGTAFNAAGDVLYVSDFCDGTLARVAVDLSGNPPSPVAAERFDFLELLPVVAPLRSDTLGLPRRAGTLRVRPGRPGIDFNGPDVFLLVGQPGLLCGIRVESL